MTQLPWTIGSAHTLPNGDWGSSCITIGGPMTTETITLTDIYAADPRDAVCQRHTGWPLHVESECKLLAGVRPFTRDLRCSICDLEWDERVAESYHARSCRGGDGSYAEAIESYRKGDDWVQVVTRGQYD